MLLHFSIIQSTRAEAFKKVFERVLEAMQSSFKKIWGEIIVRIFGDYYALFENYGPTGVYLFVQTSPIPEDFEESLVHEGIHFASGAGRILPHKAT